MANTTFTLRRSAVADKVPNTSVLSIGELAINLTDRKLFSTDGVTVFETGSNLSALAVRTTVVVGNSTVNVTVNATSFTGTANNTLFVGSTSAANVVSNSQLSANLANYQTTAGLAANVLVLTANSANYVKANNGITSNAFGVFATQGTGLVVNATGIHVNSAYIATIAANSATYANGSISNTFTIGTAAYHVANGNLGILKNNPAYPLDVLGNINSSNIVFAVHFDNVSDVSLKTNIQSLSESIAILNKLDPVSFDWKENGMRSYGLIAQQVEQILPDLVHQRNDQTKTVNYIQLIPFLIEVVQDQHRQIQQINKQLNKQPSNPKENEDGKVPRNKNTKKSSTDSPPRRRRSKKVGD